MNLPGFPQTRGGMLVGLVIVGAIGFELRTVLGMFLGVDLPMMPYIVVMIAVLSIVGVVIDVFRSVDADTVST